MLPPADFESAASTISPRWPTSYNFASLDGSSSTRPLQKAPNFIADTVELFNGSAFERAGIQVEEFQLSPERLSADFFANPAETAFFTGQQGYPVVVETSGEIALV